MIPRDTHLNIGSLLFEGIDQIDLTGPFEVLSRIPNATYRIYGKTATPVRDLRGLWLTPDAILADAPPLDVLHVPGGFGQEALMEDAEVLGWIRRQAAGGWRQAAGGRRQAAGGRRQAAGGRRQARVAFSRCVQEPCCAVRPGCSRGAARRHTGRRFTFCRSSERSPSTNVWSLMAPGSSPRALRPVSTALCASRPSCAATRPRRPFSFIWSMRQSRASTAARPRQRQPRSWKKRGDLCGQSRRSASKQRGASPPN
jgi:DJ-1/PfpI family